MTTATRSPLNRTATLTATTPTTTASATVLAAWRFLRAGKLLQAALLARAAFEDNDAPDWVLRDASCIIDGAEVDPATYEALRREALAYPRDNRHHFIH